MVQLTKLVYVISDIPYNTNLNLTTITKHFLSLPASHGKGFARTSREDTKAKQNEPYSVFNSKQSLSVSSARMKQVTTLLLINYLQKCSVFLVLHMKLTKRTKPPTIFHGKQLIVYRGPYMHKQKKESRLFLILFLRGFPISFINIQLTEKKTT